MRWRLGWPWRRRTPPAPMPQPGSEWVCSWCGWKQAAHSLEAATAALYAHRRETCVNRKVRAHGLWRESDCTVWGWTHRGCAQLFSSEWSWADAYNRALAHARSHDWSLTDEESAELACAALNTSGTGLS